MKNSHIRRWPAALVAMAAFAVAPMASALSYSAVFGFGDSLSDTGNISQATGGFPPPPYTPGRFTSRFSDGSEGQVWLEYVAAGLGASATNSLSGGTNYAWGGAKTGPANAGFPPSLIDQAIGATGYLGDVGGVADPNALYSVFGGGNDILALDSSMSVANISAIITGLADAGARNFLVPNLPDIGLTPGGFAGDSAALTALTVAFNADLRDELKILEDTLGINIISFNVFSVFNDILANAADYGFSNTTDACFDGVSLCSDPDSYLFFDDIHPTAAAHALLGSLGLKVVLETKVPLPAALPLMFGALSLLGLVRRRRV